MQLVFGQNCSLSEILTIGFMPPAAMIFQLDTGISVHCRCKNQEHIFHSATGMGLHEPFSICGTPQ